LRLLASFFADFKTTPVLSGSFPLGLDFFFRRPEDFPGDKGLGFAPNERFPYLFIDFSSPPLCGFVFADIAVLP